MIMELMRSKMLCTLVLLALVPQLTLAATPEVKTENPEQQPIQDHFRAVW